MFTKSVLYDKIYLYYIRGGKNMNILIWVGIVFVAVFLIIAVNAGDEEIEQLQRYWDIEIGMTEKEMLDIMGDGFDRSLLKNNCIKYEWRINVNSRHSRVKKWLFIRRMALWRK